MNEAKIEKVMSRCIYFNGMQNRRCKAGVAYAAGVAACWGEDGATCYKRETPTREAAIAEIENDEKRFAETLDKMRQGVCLACGIESTDWEQVGRCIYAVPCGHRAGQGDAERYKAGVIEARAKTQGGKP